LIGIILGFGRNNAAYFQERQSMYPTVNMAIWDDEIIMPILRKQANKFFSFSQYDIEDMLLPMFVGYPDSEESQALKKEYWDVRNKLINYYHGKDFLEATLNLYMHGQSIL
jgi:hypothetical protein